MNEYKKKFIARKIKRKKVLEKGRR